ncbi:MAG TPA: hypothetical protein VFS29_07545 [Motilibacteraceae bacterium]|nr:hypothetical protein [Motilibacteraceae bacterium]
MAICTMCRQDMKTADSCVAWKVPTARGDVAVIPYGQEERVVDLDDGYGYGYDDGYGDYDDGGFDDDPVRRLSRRASAASRAPASYVHVWTSERCGDCNVRRGGTHHPGCDVAECPVCHEQLFSCGCWDESVDDRELDARYGVPAPTAQQPGTPP